MVQFPQPALDALYLMSLKQLLIVEIFTIHSQLGGSFRRSTYPMDGYAWFVSWQYYACMIACCKLRFSWFAYSYMM